MNHPPGSARETLVATLGSDPYDGLEVLRKAGERKSQAAGVAYEYEHGRHIKIAQIANELAQVHADEKLSEAKLDRLARSDPRYLAYIKQAADAIAEKELATSEYFAVKSVLEWDAHSVFHIGQLAKLER